MKPRNKYEERVVALNDALSEDIAVANLDWAKKESFKCNMGFGNYVYFTISEYMAEFEVRRLYRLYRYDDKNTSHFFCMEILREFVDGDRRTFCAKMRNGFSWYYDTFLPYSSIELRQVRKNYGGYRISDLHELSIGSQMREVGERVDCITCDPKELARMICNNPIAETMYKNHELMFDYLMYQTYIPQICRAYVIAKRHGFVFSKDTIPLWRDMVYFIIKCKKDFHNPIYVAPEDLHATHNMFMDMWRRKQAKIEEKRRRMAERRRIEREEELLRMKLEQDEREKKENAAYIRRRKRFYDMVLTDGLISCTVLRDVKAFEEEGRVLDHCVFRGRYYAKPYSLILSARIDDKRIETIEVDLTSYTIKQCYGKHDHFTMYHERILELVNNQMDIIRKYNTSRRTTKIKAAV